MEDEELWPIGEVARRFGVAVSTLRYWEERGLIRSAARRARQRYYGPDEVHHIGLIQMCQDTGLMSLDEIAVVLAGTAAEHDWRAVVQERIQTIQQQIQRLTTGRTHLEHLLTCPQDHPAADCPYLREATTERFTVASAPASKDHQRDAHRRHTDRLRAAGSSGRDWGWCEHR